VPHDDIDEMIAILTDGNDQKGGSNPSPTNRAQNDRPVSPTRWGIEEQDLRRPDVGRPVYETKGTNRLTKYPWDVWMDGKPHVAVKGHNFNQSRAQFVTMMHNRARGHDLYLATRVINDNAVEFCFFKDVGARDYQRELWRAEEVALREKYKNEAPE
jgi:hypothetical protein